MEFYIYKTTLIYLALFHKRSFKPEGKITLTEKELNDYIALVLKSVEEERSIANAFSYKLISEGEPEYNLSLAPQEIKDSLKTANFSYDPSTKTYTTNSNKQALSLKSTLVYQRPINSTYQPKGYDKALNIDSKTIQENMEKGL